MRTWKTVVVESPYGGDVGRNTAYARECMRWCLDRQWSPIASHLLYTQPGVLDDSLPSERTLGISAGFAWRAKADFTVFFCRHGWSSGMILALHDCRRRGLPFVTREGDKVPP